MWIQFYSIYTLGLQKNILGKECEIGEILTLKKKNTITQNKRKLVFNEYVVLARCFIYIISPIPHKTHGLGTAIPGLHLRQQEFREDELFTGSYRVCQSWYSNASLTEPNASETFSTPQCFARITSTE